MTPSSLQTTPARLLWPTRVFILSMIVLAFGLLVHPLGDPDVYIHLRDGRHWVENKLQVDKEPFAYTLPNKSIERVEVLFRIGIYLAYQIGGYSLLTLVKALAMTGSLFMLGLLIYRRWPHSGVVWLLLALAILAPMSRIMPERPYVVTYLLLPWFLLLINAYRCADIQQEASLRRKLWLIPLVTILWSNLHPGFVVLFAFLGAQLLDDAINYWRTQDLLFLRRLKYLSLTAAATFLAGAVNPIGFSIYSFVLKTTGTYDFMKFLTEWAPPGFAHEPLFFILLGLVWSAQFLAIQRIRLFDFLPVLAFSYLALKSYRNMPLFLIAALPPLAEHLAFLWKQYLGHIQLTESLRRYGLFAGTGITLFILVGATTTGYAFRLGEIPGMYPARGLAWLLEHPVKGRLLTHDIWGGYTGWVTKGQIQVFIDGRFPLFGEKLYADYRAIIWGDNQKCLLLLDKYNIQGLLISPKNEIRLYQQLWKSGKWALIYWDDICLLYVRKNEENAPLLESFQYLAIDPKRTPFFNPTHPKAALQEARRAAVINPDSFLPYFFSAELSLRLGNKEDARRDFQETLKRAPQHTASWYNLGIMALQEKKYATAENFFRSAIKAPAPAKLRARIYYMLAQTLKSDPKRRSEALSWVKRSLQLQPAWKDAESLYRELKN